jgi:hypothetical protein
VLITAVDSNLRKLLNAWILMVRSQEPNIVKSYEIEIPLGQQTAVIKVSSNAFLLSLINSKKRGNANILALGV